VPISLFRAIASQYRDLRRVESAAVMSAISHLIEDQLLLHRPPVDVYVGFQRLSNLARQRGRYRRLAEACRRVYVFAVPDAPRPDIPGITWVDLAPEEPLAREWFLVVDAPELWCALLAQEQSASPGPRCYDGIWSYDARVVERASLLLSQRLGALYEPVAERSPERQRAHLAEIGSRLLARLERAQAPGRRRWEQLFTLHKFAEALAAQRPAAELAVEAAQLLRAAFGADDAAVALLIGARRCAVASAHAEEIEERALQLTDGPSGEALRRGRCVLLADARRSRKLDPLLPGAQSIIAAPIAARGRIYGVVTVGAGLPGRWSAEDQETVTALAALLAGALDRHPDLSVEAALGLGRADEPAAGGQQQIAAQVAELRRALELIAAGGLTPTQRAAVERARELAAALGDAAGLTDHSERS